MILPEKKITFDRFIRGVIQLLILIAFIWLLNYLSEVLIPFAAAFLIAYLLNPIVEWIDQRVKKRALSVALTFISFGLLAFISLWMIKGPIEKEIKEMAIKAKMISSGKFKFDQLPDYIPQEAIALIKSTIDKVHQKEMGELATHENVLPILQYVGSKIAPEIFNLFSGATSLVLGLMGLVVFFLYLFFILLDFERVKSEGNDLIPENFKKTIHDFIHDFNEAMGRYFRAQALVAFLMGVLFSIGFSIVGLPMAIVLGLFVGLLNMVPYLQMLGLIPACILAIVAGAENGEILFTLIGTLAVFVIAQLIQDAVLVPRIMGDATGLSPAVLLLAISIWGKLLGFLGLIIAIPATCMALAYYKRMIQEQASLPPPQTQ